MNTNENCYGEETNLIDMLFYCLKRWRLIATIMLIMAILAGGYEYYCTKKSNLIVAQQRERLGTKEETTVGNSQYYQLAIEQMIQSIQKQEEYIKNSVVMQLNVNYLQVGIARFILKTSDTFLDSSSLDVLLDAYEAYVSDGRLAERLYEENGDIPVSDLQYLLTFSDGSDSSDYIDETEISVRNIAKPSDQRAFQIRITLEDRDTCEVYLEEMVQEILAYSEELQKQIGDHILVMLTSGVSERQDQEIQDYQTKILNDYTVAVQNLNALQVEAETYVNDLNASNLDASVLSSPARSCLKSAIFGLVSGALLAVFILIALFFMNDRICSTENFENKFGICLLGRVVEICNGKGLFGFLDRCFQRLREGVYVDVPYDEQIKIVAENVKAAISLGSGLSHIMVAGTITTQDIEAVYTAIVKEIDDVFFSNYCQLIFDASALEELNDCDGVLFIEKKDVSFTRLIYQECKLAVDRNVKILGAVVI